MQTLKSKLLILSAFFLFLFSLSPALVMADAKSEIQCGADNDAGVNCRASTNPSRDINGTVRTVINLLSVIVGIVAVIMLIIGGFRYITSAGGAEKVSGAKNTIV